MLDKYAVWYGKFMQMPAATINTLSINNAFAKAELDEVLNYHDIHLLKSTRKDTVVEVVLDLYKKNLLKKPIADTVQGPQLPPLAEHEAGLLMATVMTIEDDDDLFVVDDSFAVPTTSKHEPRDGASLASHNKHFAANAGTIKVKGEDDDHKSEAKNTVEKGTPGTTESIPRMKRARPLSIASSLLHDRDPKLKKRQITKQKQPQTLKSAEKPKEPTNKPLNKKEVAKIPDKNSHTTQPANEKSTFMVAKAIRKQNAKDAQAKKAKIAPKQVPKETPNVGTAKTNTPAKTKNLKRSPSKDELPEGYPNTSFATEHSSVPVQHTSPPREDLHSRYDQLILHLTEAARLTPSTVDARGMSAHSRNCALQHKVFFGKHT